MYSQQDTGIFFIDDSDTDNFIHQQLFHRYCKNYRYTVFKTAGHALDYLKIILVNDYVFPGRIPEYIFLNLGLPGMSGFKFLDEFESLNKQMDYKIKVVIVIASINPADVAKCSMNKSVKGFLVKPVTGSSLSGFGLKLKTPEELILNDQLAKSK